MAKAKYYDWSREIPLDPQRDGCSYEEWAANFEVFPFTVHPKRFLVFLSPAELETCDEYGEGDPYEVERKLEGDFHQRRIKCTLELIKSLIVEKGENVKILDLGCGQGHITARIKQAFPIAEVSGLDYSISAVEYAVGSFGGIDFAVGDAYKPPYSEEYFDVVICDNLWEHVPNPLFLLEKIRRIIKVGGYLIISTPSRYRLKNMVRIMCGKPVTFVSRLHVTEYSVGQVIEQLKFGRFEVVKTFSKPIKNPGGPIIARIGYWIIIPLARPLLKMIGSHHSLESTVFFLAKKLGNCNNASTTRAKNDKG